MGSTIKQKAVSLNYAALHPPVIKQTIVVNISNIACRVNRALKKAFHLGRALARWARAGHFDHSLLMPVFAHTSPDNLEYLLAVSKNLAHPLPPVYDDGKGGGWKWWG